MGANAGGAAGVWESKTSKPVSGGLPNITLGAGVLSRLPRPLSTGPNDWLGMATGGATGTSSPGLPPSVRARASEAALVEMRVGVGPPPASTSTACAGSPSAATKRCWMSEPCQGRSSSLGRRQRVKSQGKASVGEGGVADSICEREEEQAGGGQRHHQC
eukprot:scaffold63768_cov33-Tisochrysis_lutea.AAC.2